MKRNKYFYEEKRLRKLSKLNDVTYRLNMKTKNYLELEEPQFAGWYVWVEFPKHLYEREGIWKDWVCLLDVLHVSKKQFIKSVKCIKFIRLCKHSFSKVYSLNFIYNTFKETGGMFNSWNTISERTYKKLPDRLKEYFSERKWTYYKDYVLDSSFPKDELIVRVKKHYWTGILVPNAQLESDETMLDTYLEQEQYYNRFCGSNYTTKRYARKLDKCPRERWNKFNSILVNSINTQDYKYNMLDCIQTEEEYNWYVGFNPDIYQLEESLLKDCKIYQKRRVI